MLKENRAELFIRVLAQELEACRAAERQEGPRQFRIQAWRFRQRGVADRKPTLAPVEPLDCLQMMSATRQGANFR